MRAIVLGADRAARLGTCASVPKCPLEANAADRNHGVIGVSGTDVVMSGIMMTRDVDTGSPYLVVHYDETSGRTDLVTAGAAGATTTVKIHRGALGRPDDARLCALVDAAAELETITGSGALEVEFAFSGDGTLHLTQIRPIARRNTWTPDDPRVHAEELESLRAFLRARLGPVPGLCGSTTILGQMPDWNPAEMIGPFPDVLARSLYELLVTDSTWHEARSALGYADAHPHSLMCDLAGRVYVDVRASANSLLPASLSVGVRTRVIDAGLRLLAAHPERHDKIELEVFPSAWHPHLQPLYEELVAHGLQRADLDELDAALLTHTRTLLRDGLQSIRALLARTATLHEHTRELLEADTDPLDRLHALLGHTRRSGAVPFAALARLAFVGTALLRALRHAGVLTREQVDRFNSGVGTVRTEMVQALAAVRRGEIGLADFLARYGHLRPGTFDLLSARYDQDPHLYFGESGTGAPEQSDDEPDALPWDDTVDARIEETLRASGLDIGSEEIVAFVRAAIAARELAKFRFTHALSAALELIAEFGATCELEREDLVHVDVKLLLQLTRGPRSPQTTDELRRIGARTRMRRDQLAKILLPGLITCVEDLDLVRPPAIRPNFVTGGRICAPLARLDGRGESISVGRQLAGRLVLIEGADPGHDWIFTHDIAGLITCYGGENSHMTVRCAEFGLPAAIGCGESLYHRLVHARSVELDCGKEVLRVLD
jgi:glutamine kinase